MYSMCMFDRKGMELADIIATTEGRRIVDDAHERIRFEYQPEGGGKIEIWDLDVSQKLATTMGEDVCYYIPAYRVTQNEEGEEERKLMRVLLFDEKDQITVSKSIFKRATIPPRENILTAEVWKENEAEICKRRSIIGGAAVGGVAVLGAGVVVGTIMIKKWVNKRR